MQRDIEKLCPPSIFYTLKVQSNQLKVIESTPTVTFGITGNMSVLCTAVPTRLLIRPYLDLESPMMPL